MVKLCELRCAVVPNNCISDNICIIAHVSHKAKSKFRNVLNKDLCGIFSSYLLSLCIVHFTCNVNFSGCGFIQLVTTF